MPTYVTKYVKNITTGEPLTFEVQPEVLGRLEYQKGQVQDGRAPMLGHSVPVLVENFELSLIPAFRDVLDIFCENGFSTDLVTKILRDFGAGEPFIQELLRNEQFILEVQPWFVGIIGDGGRAMITLKIVYAKAMRWFKTGAIETSSPAEPAQIPQSSVAQLVQP